MKVIGGHGALWGSRIHFGEKSLRCRDQHLLEGGKGHRQLSSELPASEAPQLFADETETPPPHACQKAEGGSCTPAELRDSQLGDWSEPSSCHLWAV